MYVGNMRRNAKYCLLIQVSKFMVLAIVFMNVHNNREPSIQHNIVYRHWSKLVKNGQVVKSTHELKQASIWYI